MPVALAQSKEANAEVAGWGAPARHPARHLAPRPSLRASIESAATAPEAGRKPSKVTAARPSASQKRPPAPATRHLTFETSCRRRRNEAISSDGCDGPTGQHAHACRCAPPISTAREPLPDNANPHAYHRRQARCGVVDAAPGPDPGTNAHHLQVGGACPGSTSISLRRRARSDMSQGHRIEMRRRATSLQPFIKPRCDQRRNLAPPQRRRAQDELTLSPPTSHGSQRVAPIRAR